MKYCYRGNDVKQKVTAGHLTPYDIVQLASGAVGYVLSHDAQGGAVWISTAEKIVPVSRNDLVTRLLNVTDFACECVRNPEMLRHVTPALERLYAVH